jgi:hypothetical protein
MSVRSNKWTALGLVGLGVFALSACSQSLPEGAPPPPAAVAEAPSPVLAGGPASDASDAARAQAMADAASRPGYGAMAPIPNPEDLSPAERARIYGSRHYGQRAHAWRPRHHAPRTWHPRAYAAAPAARAPAPAYVAPRPAPAPMPAPVEAKPLPMPGAQAAPAPAAPHVDSLNQLKAAVAGDVVRGSRLDVPTPELLAGKEAKVTLSLPQTLLQTIQREAAKLGLGKAAKSVSVSAKLSGEGYSITPNGAQTAKVAPGKAPVFSWMVHPTGDARKPLTATVDASLNGDGAAKRFSLLTMQQAVSALPDMAADAAGKAKAKVPGWLKHLNLKMLDIPGHENLHLPVFGKTPSHNVVALGIIALILLLLFNIAGGASRRQAKAEARRRRQTLGYGMLGGAAAADAESHAASAHAHEDVAAYDASHGHHAAAADEHAAAAHEHHAAAEADHDAGLHGAAHHEEAEARHEEHAADHEDNVAEDHRDDHGHGHGGMFGAALGGAALGAIAAHEADKHHETHAHDDHGHDAHAHDDHAHGHHGEGHDADAHDEHAVVGHQAEGHDGHGDGGHGDHGHEDHGHDAHGHDAHGHDTHAHDDHGHGHHAGQREREHEHA